MPRQPEPLDVGGLPDLLKLAEEVQRTGAPRLLQRNGEDIAVLSPAKPKRRARRRAFTRDDPLFSLIGSASSDIPGGIAERKHEFIGEQKE